MPRNLTVPDSVESSVIGNSNISGLKEAPKTAISIDMTRAPGASAKNQYIPSKSKAAQIAQARGMPVEGSMMPSGRVEKIHGIDFMTAEKTQNMLRVMDSEIVDLAKEIWEQERDSRKRYSQAKKMVEEASEEDLENPNPRLAKAIKILEKGTLSKKQAKQAAKARLLRQKRQVM